MRPRPQTFATRGEKLWFNEGAESLRIGRFNVKYILKLALVTIVPVMLIAGVTSASAGQHHHHKAGHRAHHRSSSGHHSHSATRHRNPN
jgi:hypothetical protein